MIQINLLPLELQRAAKTPKSVFYTVVGGVAATMLVGFAVLWFRMSLGGVREAVDLQRVEVNTLKERALEVDRINEDIAFYKEREKAIIEIKSKRILWTQKLYQLVRRTPPYIWITRMSLDTLEPSEQKQQKGKTQTGGTLKLTCYAQGVEVAQMAAYKSALSGQSLFYRDLIDVRALPNNFFGDFLGFSDPSWDLVILEDYAQPRSLTFVLEAHLKPLLDPTAAGKKKGKG